MFSSTVEAVRLAVLAKLHSLCSRHGTCAGIGPHSGVPHIVYIRDYDYLRRNNFRTEWILAECLKIDMRGTIDGSTVLLSDRRALIYCAHEQGGNIDPRVLREATGTTVYRLRSDSEPSHRPYCCLRSTISPKRLWSFLNSSPTAEADFEGFKKKKKNLLPFSC